MSSRKLHQYHCNQILSSDCLGNSSGRKGNKTKKLTKSCSDIFWAHNSSVAEWCYVIIFLFRIFLLGWDMGHLCFYGEKVGSQVGISSGSKCLCVYNRIESISPF